MPLDGQHLSSATETLQKAHPKHALHFVDSQQPDHLYIYERISSIKAPMPMCSKNLISVMLSHNDNLLREQKLLGHDNVFKRPSYTGIHLLVSYMEATGE